MEILPLEKAKYENHYLDFSYVSEYYYDLNVESLIGDYRWSLTKKRFREPFVNPDLKTDRLYAPYFPGAEAFGIERDGGLIAAIELWREDWSNRMRVTELWIAPEFRRKGIGRALMDFAKRKAKADRVRYLMLETQTSNASAVAFYLATGFEVVGFDAICYSNRDVDRGEVRLELGFEIF